ncbi:MULTISPECIES: methyl-accepting chemotaxis protein [unclassified Vibrio]|uniref:Methyl-accepting chemotaxis protein n=1 Tax=Vibrio sp. HB236076 TaxID=3232307 RepID=A0AB39HJE7_9VIBR|nr:methyl-accepting chemotaxis protein [Vibrio sp. HB161653]MDP5253133.1 methyl-accepting chemotaxis protein [Vibrio sp. HB161653]
MSPTTVAKPSSRFSMNLSSKMTLSFVFIGLLFVAVAWQNYQNTQQVSNGLSVINDQSSPVVRTASELDALVANIEPVILNLTHTSQASMFEQQHQSLQDNKSNIKDKLTQLKSIPLSGSLKTTVDNALRDLNEEVEKINAITQTVSQLQQSKLELDRQSLALNRHLNQLQQDLEPLLQNTLLILENDAVISVVNEINASMNNGLLIIERIIAVQSQSQLAELQNQFVQWQNSHSNLLPTLIFASQQAEYQLFVKDFSHLTLELLNAVEGEDGLLASQEQRLGILSQQASEIKVLKQELDSTSALTNALLGNAFTINQQLSQSIDHRVEQQNRTSLLIGLTLIAAIVIISLWLSRLIKQATRGFTHEFEALSEGQLKELALSGKNDEFGRLNDLLVNVIAHLKETVLDIRHSSDSVEHSVKTVSSSATQTRQIVEQQKHELDSIAAALVEMNATAQEVAQHTDNTHSKVLQATELSRNGRQQVQDSRRGVDQMVSQTAKTISAINDLNQGVRSIEGIIDTITAIAEQTNLLALNAAIEAARAGEYGRGFAVVADEVRELATRTQKSTLEIQDKIAAMVNDAQTAVSVINQSEEIAASSLEQAQVADATILEFEQLMNEIQDLSHLVSTAAEQQAATLKELDQNINQVALLADSTNQQAENTETEAGKQVGFVQSLEKSLARFKVVQ